MWPLKDKGVASISEVHFGVIGGSNLKIQQRNDQHTDVTFEPNNVRNFSVPEPAVWQLCLYGPWAVLILLFYFFHTVFLYVPEFFWYIFLLPHWNKKNPKEQIISSTVILINLYSTI
jgi:hypothetical protein